ncbi:hypothetical protein CAY60_000525 [Shouchella clausii]|uniref:hypothetical protein n=1 Tax=Shouchella TaxID=2893057 RepID=UPI000690A7DA|nr:MULTISPECIES: hypothetical protein [Shouchella]MBU3229885.1 hypothetical protein [Shouchella clausii]MBU3264031.1 hypothetical protein [Shouchella clausii]MBU3506786.1 hypothetical protein [Shouchella clausii]MBU3535149.1 hypothetical protein [Shouchella clausii]MBX0307836.1 hypothetical protein [Shouchella clausii]
MKLTKHDFYFGSLLSLLVKSGFAPAIIDGGELSRIYSLSLDQGDIKVYAKYSSKPCNEKKEEQRWDYHFSKEEVNKIEGLIKDNSLIFALICGQERLKNSEITFLDIDQLKECLGSAYRESNRRVSIKVDKRGRSFYAYGSGLDGVEKPIKIKRNAKERLKEFFPNLDNFQIKEQLSQKRIEV